MHVVFLLLLLVYFCLLVCLCISNSSFFIFPSTAIIKMAVGQNQWYHFGVGAPPILVYFSGDWDVHWG